MPIEIFDYENDDEYDDCIDVYQARLKCHIQRLLGFLTQDMDDDHHYDDIYYMIKEIAVNIVEYKKIEGDYEDLMDEFYINYSKFTPEDFQDLDNNLTEEEKDILFDGYSMYDDASSIESWNTLSEEMKTFILGSGKINRKELYDKLSEGIGKDEIDKLKELFDLIM